MLAPVTVQRADSYCAPCQQGVIPKDQALDIVGTAFSPGVRRMLGRVGGQEAFAAGQRDVAELAGVRVTTKAVERVAEALGAQVEAVASAERTAALTGKVVALQPVPRLYIAIDGTGVPMVPHETEGRQGKGETGKAKTREAKLGCVFTQTRVDERGRPVRDADPTTCVGAIEPAEAFGCRIYAEAVRRGRPAGGAGQSSWGTGRPGSGGSPRSTSPGPSRSSTSTTPGSTSPISASSSPAPGVR